MAFTVGQAQIKLVPSMEGFNEAVQAEGAKLDDIRIGVVVDDATAKASLDDVKLSADELGAKSPTVTPKVDDADAIAKLKAVKVAADAASGAGGGGGGLFGLASAAASLGPALVPIGATLTAGIGALLPVLLSAGAGMGAFALAASGDLKGLKSDLDQTLQSFQKLTAPVVEPVIGDALKLVIPIFSTLVPLVDSTAGELDKLANSAKSALQAPFWQGFITFISSQAGPAIGSLGSLFGGVAKGFAGLTQAMGPLITGLEGDLAGIGNSIASFGQNAGSNSGFQSFLAYVEREAPVVGQLFLNLGDDAGKFIADLAPLGAGVLAVLDPVTQFAGVLLSLHGPFGINIVDVGLAVFAFSKLAPLASSAALAIQTFGIAVTDQKAFGAVAGGSTALERMVAAMGGIGPAAALAVPLVAAVGFAFWQSGNQAAIGEAQAKAFLDGVTTEASATLPQLTAKLGDLNQKFDDLKSAYTSGKLGMDGLIDAGNSLQASIKATAAEQDNYRTNLNTLEGKLGLSQSAVEKLASSININLGTALSPAQIRQFTAALQEQAAQSGLTKSALEALAASAETSTANIAKQVTAATSTATTAWKSYGDAVTAFSSSTLPVTSAAIAKFYTTQATQGAQFTANIQKAIKDGYDPSLISSILQAGPAQASQLLQGLVSAQGTGLKNLISQTTAALASEGAAAVEEARLTAEAVAAKSSIIAAELPQALALSQALTATNAAAAVQTVADQYGLGTGAVLAIAKQYGIALPKGITDQISAASTASLAQTEAAIAPLTAGVGPMTTAGTNLGGAAATGVGLANLKANGVALLQQLVAGLSEDGSNKSMAAAATAAATTVLSIVAQQKGAFATAGGDLTTGLATGMLASGPIQILEAAAAQAVASAKTAAQTAAKSHSPSLLFANEVGTYLTQGIAQGMTDPAALGSLRSAANTVMRAAVGAAKPLSLTFPLAASASASAPTAQSSPHIAISRAAGGSSGALMNVGTINNNTPADSAAMAQMLASLGRSRKL